MSAKRACAQCRAAKSKCVYPSGTSTCMHCTQRGLACSSPSSTSTFQFRNENEVAERNSKRARREGKGAVMLDVAFEVRNNQQPAGTSTSESKSIEDQQDAFAERYLPWLSDKGVAAFSAPLKRDLETRAIERFFVDWVLHPSNRGISPGHFSDLPALYHSAPKECVLTLAVRAVAFADMREYLDGETPFYIKARRNYGAALNRMRTVAVDDQKHGNDRVLAGLLLIDNFELMYLARSEPLGPHESAVRHVLHMRGNEQFLNNHSYALWRIATQRLQSRQILLREEPDHDQIEWMSLLNADRPDIHLAADVLHMNILCAAANKMIHNDGQSEAEAFLTYERASHLSQSIQELLDAMASWNSHMSAAWTARVIDADELTAPAEIARGHTAPPPLPSQVLGYGDFWLACAWNFHRASEIVLRESLVDVIEYGAETRGPRGECLSLAEQDRISEQRSKIEGLSEMITQTFPPLLGYTDEPGEHATVYRGKMAGRQSMIFPSLVIQRARFTPMEHKDIASGTIDWIHFIHGL